MTATMIAALTLLIQLLFEYPEGIAPVAGAVKLVPRSSHDIEQDLRGNQGFQEYHKLLRQSDPKALTSEPGGGFRRCEQGCRTARIHRPA